MGLIKSKLKLEEEELKLGASEGFEWRKDSFSSRIDLRVLTQETT